DFRAFTQEARLTEWMQQHFDQIDEYIESILTPKVLGMIADHNDMSADKLKLTVIINAATAADAMAQLRKPRIDAKQNTTA
ncbi:MAG: hypothetical protein L0H70_00860, partial [Xanthomonadales bacterium]|nr:hypothetical protein [Xanthomonadales bacterium]